ncbi:hypothetical protein Tco_0144147 [Tanacetum coccineum]
MFARGDVQSARILIEALDEFKRVSGLVPSRHQLVIAVLSSMHLYWAFLFILPVGFIHDIKQLMCGFLLCQREMKRGKAKVSWDYVCLPTNEGRLGVRKLDTVNIALMTSHIWKLIAHKESMWVRWIHAYKLKKRSFWEVSLVSNVSWGWRKLLQIRNTVRPYFWYKIGNGKKASVWYNTWDELCPLMNHVSYIGLSNVGFDHQETVANVIDTLHWKLHDGVLSSFSVRNAWHTVRVRVVASSYSVWQERNNIIHGKGDRRPEQVTKIVVDIVRLKLASIHFKKKARVDRMHST